MMRTSPLHLSQVSMSISKTRFNLCAQVIAMDGMYAGFAGAKTGHRSPFFGSALVTLLCYMRLLVFTPSGRCYLCPILAVGCKYTMKADQVDSGFWHQGNQSGNKVQRLKYDVCCTVTPGCL